jgi:hypothetical protein
MSETRKAAVGVPSRTNEPRKRDPAQETEKRRERARMLRQKNRARSMKKAG